jgi:serine/threonine protein phosphatase 1
LAQAQGVIYAIGDIHGHADLFRSILSKILEDAKAGKPRLVLMGDYIDRGTQSREVIGILLSPWFRSTFNPITLMGNHEAMLLAAMGNQKVADQWMHFGGAETIESYGIEFGMRSTLKVMDEFRRKMPADHIGAISQMPLSHAEGKWFFTHAGVRPGVALAEQISDDLLWIREPFLTHEGEFGAVIVHGHSTTKDPEILPNRIGLDTGCGYGGGMLSAAALHHDGSVRLFQAGPS